MVTAVNHATQILHWQENMLPDEMPPAWMWMFDDELEDWFDALEEKRQQNRTDPTLDEDLPEVNELVPKMPKIRR